MGTYTTFEKKLIFTVTAGRTGTTYLAKLLDAVEDITAFHEPNPNFVSCMRAAQNNPLLAHQFWEKAKIPTIKECRTSFYSETSHLCCKGFIEPLINIGIEAPYLIALRRPPREIAISYLERNTVPGRTSLGLMYCRMPSDPMALPFPGWELATDYQLCYWMALDMEVMVDRYKALYRNRKWEIFDCTSQELKHLEVFFSLLNYLGLSGKINSGLKATHTTISEISHNPNPSKLRFNEQALAKQENRVWERVKNYFPFLRESLCDRFKREV